MSRTTIKIVVNGHPKGQPRHRACIRGKHAGIYNPGTADDWKALVAIAARDHTPPQQMTGPVQVDIDFYFPRPKRLCRKKDSPDRLFHTSKPDRDNCEKAVLDVLTQVGFWLDDSQVCDGTVRKFYHAIGSKPGATINICDLGTP